MRNSGQPHGCDSLSKANQLKAAKGQESKHTSDGKKPAELLTAFRWDFYPGQLQMLKELFWEVDSIAKRHP